MADNPWRMSVDGKPVITKDEHEAAVAEAVRKEQERLAGICDARAAAHRVDASLLPQHTASPNAAKMIMDARIAEADACAAALRAAPT